MEGKEKCINEFKVHALCPTGPLRTEPVKAANSAEAWSLAEKQVRTIQDRLGMPCRLMAVVWVSSDPPHLPVQKGKRDCRWK